LLLLLNDKDELWLEAQKAYRLLRSFIEGLLFKLPFVKVKVLILNLVNSI